MGKKLPRWQKFYQNARAWTGELAGFLLERTKTLGTRLPERPEVSESSFVMNSSSQWGPLQREIWHSRSQGFDPFGLTKRIEALWTRMEIWGSQFMKLLHKFPYGRPYGPVMWRAFERKGKKRKRKKKERTKLGMCFHSLRIFYKKRGDEILGLLWDGVEVFRIKFVFDVSYSSTRFFNCFSLKRRYSA